MESSCQGPHNWWFHCRFGARDIPYLGAKRFHDRHIRNVLNEGVRANFLAPQLGWWSPRLPADGLRGHFTDEIEYFAGKNAGWDAASSILGVDVTKGALPFGQLRQMTILGWYERPRLAGAFRPEVTAALRQERAEFRLRQGSDGVWRIRPIDVTTHRVSDAMSAEWLLDRPVAGEAMVRVEALYAPDDTEWEKGETLVRGEDFGVFTATSITNRSVAFAGPHYRNLNGKTGFGLKVKGDGSGALLNIQFCGAPQYGRSLSEHYVRLDFTGWRYFSFLERERDSASADDQIWPYDTTDRVCGTLLDIAHLASVDFWLNDIPLGKATTVEISDVRLLSERKKTLHNASLMVNGKNYPLPFDLVSGEYAELESDAWIRFSADGMALERCPAGSLRLSAGSNAVAFSGGRAEVSFFALGKPEPALVSQMTDEMRRGMSYEANEPVRYAPRKGFEEDLAISVRPGESAVLRLSYSGVLANPNGVLTDDNGERIDVRLPCRTQGLKGSWRLHLNDPNADVILNVVKEYDFPR